MKEVENGLAEKVGYKVRQDEARSNTCGVSKTEVRNYAEGMRKCLLVLRNCAEDETER